MNKCPFKIGDYVEFTEEGEKAFNGMPTRDLPKKVVKVSEDMLTIRIERPQLANPNKVAYEWYAISWFKKPKGGS